jgi:hypothetical protein
METVPKITLAGALSLIAACPMLERLSIRNALHFDDIDLDEILPLKYAYCSTTSVAGKHDIYPEHGRMTKE